MSRSWDLTATGSWATYAKTKIKNALDGLMSMLSGAGVPATTVAYMQYVDTDDGIVKQRNAADSASIAIRPAAEDIGRQSMLVTLPTGLSASANYFIAAPHQKTWQILRVRLLSDTTSSGSDGSNNWAFQIRNLTAAADLLSTSATTNGSEITADTPYDIVADQNDTIAIDDVIEFQATKTGSATTLGVVALQIEYTITV